MIGTIILTFILAFVIRYYMITRPRESFPPSPTFRFPLIGHAYYLFKGQLQGFETLRKKLGKIYTVWIGPLEMTYVNDYGMCQEMLSKEVFSGRYDIEQLMPKNTLSMFKGGHGFHGLIGSFGDEWKEQRRFTLRHLRDFGFGRSSMNDLITDEWKELAAVLRKHHEKGEEVETHLLFNLIALNVLWKVVAGKRYDLNDKAQCKLLEELAETFAQFGMLNPGTLFGLSLPKWALSLMQKQGNPIMDFYAKMFKMFEEEYKEHEKTYDESFMRDFIDVYMTERNRVNKANEKTSSFYGQTGHWNYVNAMFDLFLAGSETTSTTMTFFILYLLHHPSLQRELQNEIDSVVGRDRQPTLDDRDEMPKVLAFISEVHRRATVAPFAVQHSTLQAVEFRGFKFPKNHCVVPNLAAIMNDPEKFPNPEKFDPKRFIDQDTGKYKPSPYMCQYGIGKRECLGVSLAKNEQFIFLTNMLHSFTVEPSSTDPLPGVDEAKISITRVPVAFRARFVPRKS